MDINDTKQNIFSTPIWGVMLSENYHNLDYIEYFKKFIDNKFLDEKFIIPDVNISEVGLFREFFKELIDYINFFAECVPKKELKILNAWSEIGLTRNINDGFNNPETTLKAVYFVNNINRKTNFFFANPLKRYQNCINNLDDYPLLPQSNGLIFYPNYLDYYYNINTPYKQDDPLMTINFNIGV